MSTFTEVNYNKVAKTLTLVFGYDVEKVYTFTKVPAKVGNGMMKAESQGKFFHANVRSKFEQTSEYR